MPQADDTIKCDARAAATRRLRAEPHRRPVGPAPAPRSRRGVCDYTKRGVDRMPTVPWLSYTDGPGGKPLGDPDASSPFGCLSAARRSRRKAIGRVRVGITRRRLARRVPGAGSETTRSWRWCVKRSRGKVRAAFTRKGRVALVATTRAAHGNGRMRPGARACPSGLVRGGQAARHARAPRQGALPGRGLAGRGEEPEAPAALPASSPASRRRSAASATTSACPATIAAALEVACEVRHQPVGGAVVAEHRAPRSAGCPGGPPPRPGARPAPSPGPGPGGRRRPRSPRRRWSGRRRRRRSAPPPRSGAAFGLLGHQGHVVVAVDLGEVAQLGGAEARSWGS